MIKDNKFIVETQVNKDKNLTVYTLINGCKLSDAFYYLPNGIIDKTETGIGGTTCELEANRNSILVLPFNNLAQNKAEAKTRNGNEILFYGSIAYKRSKKTVGKKLSTITHDPKSDLEVYIKKCDAAKKNLKITCIINQVSNLFAHLKELEKHPPASFHLVLDEIDTMQEQSSFRKETISCINLYKKHPENKRSMISATIIKFHDDVLKKEPHTVFKYQHQNKPDLYIIPTKNIKEEAVRLIIATLKQSNEKILVACNNFDYCLDIIKALEKDLATKKRKTKILCSKFTQIKAGKYFSEIGDNGVLPAEINLVTAAYFNGHDILEKYHSIILAEMNSSSLRLSPKLIYQISGRCRINNGLLSNQLIISFSNFLKNKYHYYTLEELTGDVEDRSALSEFTKQLKKSKNALLVKASDEIENVFLEGTKNMPSVYEIDKAGNYTPSYFKIDSRIEQQETHKLYSQPASFYKELKKRFRVINEQSSFKPGDIKLIEKKDSVKASVKLLEQLKILGHESDFHSEIKNIQALLISPCVEEKTLLSIYYTALSNKAVDNVLLYELTKKILSGTQIKARLKELDTFLRYKKYVLVDPLFRGNLESYFPVGGYLTVNSVNDKVRLLLLTFKTIAKTKDKNIRDLIRETKPNTFKKALLKITSKNTKSTKGILIQGYNNYEITREDDDQNINITI